MKKNSLNRAVDSAVERWQMKQGAIVVNERRRMLSIRFGRKIISERFDPYTPKAKILSWIGRQVLGGKIRESELLKEAILRKQKKLF